MDRNSKIFAKTINVGGVRKPAKKPTTTTPTNKPFDALLSKLKGEMMPTVLDSFSYKAEDKIFNFPNPRIRSITKNRKHVAFLINGDSTVISNEDAMKEFAKQEQETTKEE